jgi:hypothetical protein
MKYIALKNIFCNGKQYGKGSVFYSDITFSNSEAIELETSDYKEERKVEVQPEEIKLDSSIIPESTYICPICQKTHTVDSEIGIRHFKEANQDKNPAKVAVLNLKKAFEISNKLGFKMFAMAGLVLGITRDGDFIKGDEDDMDFGTLDKHVNIDELIKEFENAGFSVYHIWKHNDKVKEISFSRWNCKVELWFFTVKKLDAWSCVFKNEQPIPVVYPSKFFKTTKSILFKGIKINVPKKTEDYLTYKYGNWKKKVGRGEYKWDDPQYNKAIKPNYKI